MINLTSLNGVSFALNTNLIETIENIPETKITLTTGKYFLVAEERQDIIDKIIQYNRQIFQDTIKL
ncbi:flagellar FlbD family protein [Clostridium sp. KNHs216]|uniref:flagellar FlbD family protein n=1 Tax=Clostridium sp. KNHs216 TaxID=1550235 RepID=UPI0011538786|nr:flagellar FlbD family protein [Clostridium sp. KNHs216]TQI65450.1 flagellar protein FlbD [Clostridium sp. KNHs216]